MGEAQAAGELSYIELGKWAFTMNQYPIVYLVGWKIHSLDSWGEVPGFSVRIFVFV